MVFKTTANSFLDVKMVNLISYFFKKTKKSKSLADSNKKTECEHPKWVDGMRFCPDCPATNMPLHRAANLSSERLITELKNKKRNKKSRH